MCTRMVPKKTAQGGLQCGAPTQTTIPGDICSESSGGGRGRRGVRLFTTRLLLWNINFSPFICRNHVRLPESGLKTSNFKVGRCATLKRQRLTAHSSRPAYKQEWSKFPCQEASQMFEFSSFHHRVIYAPILRATSHCVSITTNTLHTTKPLISTEHHYQ